jgi:hypothetical protein
MPRYSSYSDSWYEERAMDKYYEYLEEACDCYLAYDDDPVGAELPPELQCDHCVRRTREASDRAERERREEQRQEAERLARLAANPYKAQILFIGNKLKEVAAAQGTEAKVEVVRILFTYLLEQQQFLSVQPKFRAAVVNKMNELRADEKATVLLPLFDQVDTMLAELPAREDYRA